MAAKKLNGLEKTAVLLWSLPAAVFENVLKHMDTQQAGLVRAEWAKVGVRSDLHEVLTQVLEEAAEVLTSDTAKLGQATVTKPDATPASIEKPDTATTIQSGTAESKPNPQVDIRLAADTVERPANADIDIHPASDPLRAIAQMPPDLLAQALESENTRTISLLMNYLDIEIAVQIYKRLTPAKRKEVSTRFTEQATVSEALLLRIAQAVLRKCQSIRASVHTGAAEPGAREKRMAALLRGLERNERTELLTILEGADAELAGRVKGMLYQFEDILRMQNLSVQKLLAEIDTKSLSLALFGAAAETREKLFNNLSKRAQDSLREEIELAGTVASAKVRQVQHTIVEAIQKLDQRGDSALLE